MVTATRELAYMSIEELTGNIQRKEAPPARSPGLGIKDIYECGPTLCGSRSLEHYVAEKDGASAAKLK